ncbi:MAG: nucleotidyltransferase domain-containing protein [bacterium]
MRGSFMFTPDERSALRQHLVETAAADSRIVAAALTGSAALDAEDRWSDIDLAFGYPDSVDRDVIIADWTERLYRDHGAVHHMDVIAGSAMFRVFLLASTLQVDLGFWPASDFGAIAPSFRLLFGHANERPAASPALAHPLLDMGWLYALHARSSLARGRMWQAAYMISGMRDQVLALACVRHGLPAVQGRGLDDLPPAALRDFVKTLASSLEHAELSRAFRATGLALLAEIERVDFELARRLHAPLDEIIGP